MLTPQIDRIRQATAAQRKGAARAAGGGGFAAHLRDARPGDAAPAEDTAATAALAALLEAQQVDAVDPDATRQAAAGGAGRLLDRLQDLQVDLLDGRVPAGRLAEVAAALRELPRSSGDSRLDDIVASIEFRAQIELAKLQRSS